MLIILSLMLIFVLVGVRLWHLSSPTTGRPISATGIKSALIVIDAQEGIVNRPHYYQRDSLIQAITLAIEQATKQEIPVIFIQHSIKKQTVDSFFTGGQMAESSPETALIAPFVDLATLCFPKHRADAFSESRFENYLLDNHITQVYLVGADASACVYRTAQGAVNRGYDTIILENGLFAINDKTKEKMLKKYKKYGIHIEETFVD